MLNTQADQNGFNLKKIEIGWLHGHSVVILHQNVNRPGSAFYA